MQLSPAIAQAVVGLWAIGVLAEPTVYLEETFQDGDGWKSRWVQSQHDEKYGEWKLSHGKLFVDETDMGIQTSQDARFYAISRKLDKPINNRDTPLVIAYSVKFEQDIDCGGGYIKLMDKGTDLEEFNGKTPYRIMFGPDICGPEKRVVHAILSHKGKNFERKGEEVVAMADEFTHVYKLVLYPNNTYQIWVDNKKEASGYLENDWEMVKPRVIEDPNAKKPDDWDERLMIPDPNATKPEDWDKPETIVDKDAVKPDDWDDDMDGEWEPPTIANPEYKGEWKPPTITNPKYKGEWKPPKIDNPEFVPEPDLHVYRDVDTIGIELWQVKSGTIFDNLLITDDLDHAKQFFKDKLSKLLEVEKVESDKKDKATFDEIAGRFGGKPGQTVDLKSKEGDDDEEEESGDETEEKDTDEDFEGEEEKEEKANVKEEL
uniref:Calreticulin n=1 Tax=Trichuris muris TaxID=70415 RepID=A0A5S6QCM0_TRIMR